MVQHCVRMHAQPKWSLLLRKAAEMTVADIVHFLFTSHGSKAKLATEEQFAAMTPTSTKKSGEIQKSAMELVIEETEPAEQFVVVETESPANVPFTMAVLVDVFRYLCSLINPDEPANTDSMRMMSLNLINNIIEIKGQSFPDSPDLMSVVSFELTKYLIQSLRPGGPPPLLTSTFRVCFNLFATLRVKLRFQFELFLHSLIALFDDKISDNVAESILELLVQFCEDPTFVVDIFCSYDCEVSSGNLLEELIDFLYRVSHFFRPKPNLRTLRRRAFNICCLPMCWRLMVCWL